MCTVGWGVQAVQVQEVSFQKRTKKDQYYQNQKLLTHNVMFRKNKKENIARTDCSFEYNLLAILT